MGKNKREKTSIAVRIGLEIARRELKKEEQKQQRRLRGKEREEFVRKALKRKILQISIGAAIGVSAVIAGGVRMLNSGNENQKNPPIESEVDFRDTETQSKRDEFLASIRDDSQEKEEALLQEIEKEINELEGKDDITKYIKNMYIEEYEEKTGDAELTTEDIKIIRSNQDYVYVTEEGQIVTHGETPLVTEEKLKADNQEYTKQGSRDVYSIWQDGKIIDCMTIVSEDGEKTAVQVIPGDRYEEMKEYQSVLQEIGLTVEAGYTYMENFGYQPSKEEFIKKVQEQAIKTAQTEQVQNVNSELENNQGIEPGE